jgi:2-C-methyl-D-erythritol 4-phosphate cytidylyltransferase/2-C-methyl-D-erythritol 2,4-cyclodiphosphate synthase
MDVGILLLAAGSGNRFGGVVPKQYVQVCGKPLLMHTLEHLALEPRITVVQPVIAQGDEYFSHAVAGAKLPFDLLPAVYGGAERSISMMQGLKALPTHVDMVAVHDAARPLPSAALLADVFDMAEQFGAAVPGIAVTDTIKQIDTDGKVIDTPERSFLRAVQTPQVARRDWFDQAIVREAERLHLHTDDASLLEAAGFPVHISRGDVINRKITTSEDMIWLQRQLTCTIDE